MVNVFKTQQKPAKAEKEEAKVRHPKDGRLTELMDKFLDEAQPEIEEKVRAGFVFHPSQVNVMADPRDIELDFLSKVLRPEMQGIVMHENRVDPQLRRIFDNGTMTHRRIQEYLAKMTRAKKYPFKLIKDELPIFDKEYRIGGNTDGVIEVDGELYILEIKTINTTQFRKLTEPLWKHMDQAHLYMYCADIPQAIFLYEDKNTQALKDFVVQRDEDKMDRLLGMLAEARDAIQHKYLLPYRMIGSKSPYAPIRHYTWEEIIKPGYFDWDTGKWIDE